LVANVLDGIVRVESGRPGGSVFSSARLLLEQYPRVAPKPTRLDRSVE